MDELGLTDYFLRRFGVVGTADEIVDRLVELNARGVGQVNLHAWDLAGVRILGEQVFPRVNELLARAPKARDFSDSSFGGPLRTSAYGSMSLRVA